MPSVVITGLGAITPIGVGAEAFHEAQLAGCSGVRPIHSFDASGLPVTIAGEIDLDLVDRFSKRELLQLDRFAALALIAADLALLDSGLELDRLDSDRIGTFIASAQGGLVTIEEQSERFLRRGHRALSPFTIPRLISNSAAAQVSRRFGITGPSSSAATACAAGSDAIVNGYQAIVSGEVDIAIVGGAEAPVTAFGIAAFAAMQALSTRNDDPARASRPFALGRDGFILAEGAGVLILEERECARQRGARMYAEIAGFGRSSDAHHIAAPHPTGAGASRAMTRALVMARVGAESVGYINAHGTSTIQNDLAEVMAIKRVFPHSGGTLAVSSTKSMIGHSLGAAGAIEAVATAQALASQILPPTINHHDPDPELDLDFVPNEARNTVILYAMSNSFAFGGHNVSLLFKKA